MSPLRSVSVHAVLLVVAAGAAYTTYGKDEKAAAKKEDQVEIWGGSPDKVEKVGFESPKRNVSLEPRRDSVGRWYVGTVDKEIDVPAPPRPMDAGPDAAAPPKPPAKREQSTFVGVTEADKFVTSVAPMMAMRALGKIDEARVEEFGLDKPEGTLRVSLAGKPHALVLGGSTPGGSDRYVRDPDHGDVFVISGDVARSLLSAESRLAERDLHEWKPEEIAKVKLSAGSKSREIVRIEDQKGFWADPATPAAKDETASNWMSKLEKLRPLKHVEKLVADPKPADQVVRVEYFGKSQKSLGWVELTRTAADKSGKGDDRTKPDAPGKASESDYVAKTEFSRWYATVLKSTAEQIDQDLGSVLK